MAAWPQNIPVVNGAVECGIAAGIDPSLADSRKLVVFVLKDQGVAICKAATLRQAWASHCLGADEVKKTLIVNAIAVGIDTGIFSGADGDVILMLATNDLTEVAQYDDEIAKRITVENMRTALTVVSSTKINWWMMNHHVGQEDFSGYAHKVCKMYYPKYTGGKELFHQLGHWASTLRVLRSMLPTTEADMLRVVQPIFNPTANIVLADDAGLRMDSFPAGTHRVSVLHRGLSIMPAI